MSDVDMKSVIAEAQASLVLGGETQQPGAADKGAASATAITDAEEAPAGDGDGQPDTGKPSATAQKSINRLTRQRAEAERRAMRLEVENEVLRRTAPAPSPVQPKSAELKQSDYATYDEYIRAQAADAARGAVREETEAAREGNAQREARQAGDRQRQAFETEATKQALAAGLDFEEAWETLQAAPRVSPAVAAFLYEADHKAVLADHLAKNPDELSRLSELPPMRAVRELALLEARLGRKTAPPTTQAPAPVPTLRGGGAVPQSIDRMGHEDLMSLVHKWSRK